MRTTRVFAITIAAALALATHPLRAQIPEIPDVSGLTSDPKFAAYVAITSTPLGILPPLLSGPAAPATTAGLRGIGFRAQFGQITDPVAPEVDFDLSRRLIAGGIDIALGPGTLGLTAGYLDYGCDELRESVDFDEDGINDFSASLGCGSGMAGAVTWSMPLVRTVPAEGGGTSFLVGLDAGLGVGSGEMVQLRVSAPDPQFPLNLSLNLDASTLATGVGLPVGLVARSGGVTVIPHIQPRLAWGRTSVEFPGLGDIVGGTDDEFEESDVRFMLGGGVGLEFASGLGLHFGVQKVFVEDGKLAFGAGLSWAMR